MSGLDKTGQADCFELAADTGYIYAERIVVNVELIVPKEIHDIASGADGSGVFKKIPEDFQFIFCQLRLLSAQRRL